MENNEKKIHFVAIFPIHMAHYVYDIFSPNNVELLENNKLKVSANIIDNDWLHSFLMFFGADIEIVEPPALAETIRQQHLAAAQIYRK